MDTSSWYKPRAAPHRMEVRDAVQRGLSVELRIASSFACSQGRATGRGRLPDLAAGVLSLNDNRCHLPRWYLVTAQRSEGCGNIIDKAVLVLASLEAVP